MATANPTPLTRVVINGHLVTVTANDVLGNPGGQGTVYKAMVIPPDPASLQATTYRARVPQGRTVGKLKALKIYHVPPGKRMQKKLAELVRVLTGLPGGYADECVSPEDLAYDPADETVVVGFAMRLLESGFNVWEALFNRKFREANDVTTRDVLDLAIRLVKLLDVLHQSSTPVRIGDLNPRNELFKTLRGLLLALIDMDSVQIGNFPCEVATERFLNPRLYGRDLSSRPLFTDEDDFYSFWALLLNAVLLAHPYGGSYRAIPTIPGRATARVWLLDKRVVFPVNAYPPTLLTDELLHVLEEVFAKGHVVRPEVEMLEAYRNSLLGCPTCGLWYPAHLKECPGCQAINQAARRLGAALKEIMATELLTVGGPLLFYRVIGTTIYAISRERGQAVLYIKESLATARRVVLFPAEKDTRYEVFSHYLAVCKNSYAELAEIEIYDISGNSPVFVTTTATENFAGHRALFRGSRDYLYRAYGGVIYRGSVQLGNVLVESAVGQATPHQTWFDADANSATACGFSRIFRQYFWFLIRDRGQDTLDLAELDDGESLLDQCVRFSQSSLLIMRRTEIRGIEYMRLDVVAMATAKVTSSRRVKLSDSPHLENLHAASYGRGVVLVPTDGEGIVAENVATGGQRVFAEAKPFVDAGSVINLFENGLLVRFGAKAIKLVLGQKKP